MTEKRYGAVAGVGSRNGVQEDEAMTTGKWNDIAETAALSAVVASLVVVIIELRQTRVALQAGSYQARSFQSFDHHMDMPARPVLDSLSRESLAKDFGPESLAPQRLHQLERLYMALRADFDNEHYPYQQGLLDPGFYHATTAWLGHTEERNAGESAPGGSRRDLA
jgi:hypothetical protein